jgi:predicted AAA+ superfamily ATPase
VGGLINISELSSTVGVAMQTIQNYLWYLEKTYIINRVTPYFRNVRKEITKAPLYYFSDTGLRNYILGLFGVPTVTLINGHLFENFVFNKLIESVAYASTSIHFWRTRDNAEVDFVVQTGTQLTPVEAKYTKIGKPEIPRSMRSFLHEYKPETAYIIHLGERNKCQIDGTSVLFVPFYEEILTTDRAQQ